MEYYKRSHPKVLIVGTIPYNKSTSSRAFDAYFHRWEKENIRQIFSNTKTPVKGHCGSLYQITDARLVKRWLHRIDEVGVVFEDKDLKDEWESDDLEVGNKMFDFLYRFGSKESAFKHIIRKIIWKKKYWNTKKLNEWLDDFKPECVFLAFSDDFFIPEIALYVAQKYNIPIMSCIGDDYIFNDVKSFSPFYHIYRRTYKRFIRKIFEHGGSAIYIGNKIRDKYNREFGINGDTVYLTSEIVRHGFRAIDSKNLKVTYCGNIRLGRNYSLCDIANELGEINSEYVIDVYSAEKNQEFIKPLEECKFINFHGMVPYSEVESVLSASDIVIIVEGFSKETVTITKYSLSTKAADALATGSQILAYGSLECGVIEYIESTGAAAVCTNKRDLKRKMQKLIFDSEYQKSLYDNAIVAFSNNHDSEKNLDKSEKLFEVMIDEYRKQKESFFARK